MLLDFSHEALLLAVALWLGSGQPTVSIGHRLYVCFVFSLAICLDLLQLIKLPSLLERSLVKEARDRIKCCAKGKLYHDVSSVTGGAKELTLL